MRKLCEYISLNRGSLVNSYRQCLGLYAHIVNRDDPASIKCVFHKLAVEERNHGALEIIHARWCGVCVKCLTRTKNSPLIRPCSSQPAKTALAMFSRSKYPKII